jgi:NADH-quinone oxidoreductase subunit L
MQLAQDNWWPLALIVLFPALGALTNGLLALAQRHRGKTGGEGLVTAVALTASWASFVVSAWAVWTLLNLPEDEAGYRALSYEPYRWIPSALLQVGFKLVVDPLAAVMILIVTGVGSIIHVYSVGYMHGERGYDRYFAYLNLFLFAMLVLVLGGNFLLLFVGWEGVGLCSYLLIGYNYDKKFAADAGKKAFVVNRIGDFGFVIGMLFVLLIFGTLDFDAVLSSIGEHRSALLAPVASWAPSAITVLALALFLGACGKSAQIPLYVWLPDAMAGPTPVSALIHAATMVTAGVYMVVRCHPLFVLSPTAMAVVAVVGAATAIFAATIGLVQNDIKKVLAYSTVSQLGYMFLGCGVGAFVPAIFHVMTHAFFKACLFLGSGSVIHAMHHAYHHVGDHHSDPQDIRNMGGLRSRLPWTFWTFLVATVAIAGLPPLAGFYSKDEILWNAFNPTNEHASFGLWLIGWCAAGLTAFYMFRLLTLTFLGPTRLEAGAYHHVKDSPRSMVAPLVILAALSIVGGWINVPHVLGGHEHLKTFLRFIDPVQGRYTAALVLEPVAAESPAAAPAEPAAGGEAGHAAEAADATHHLVQELSLMWLSIGIALGGILVALGLYLIYPDAPGVLRMRLGRLYDVLYNKYYVDELYEATVVDGTKRLGDALVKFDGRVVDGAVNGVARGTVWTSDQSVKGDLSIVDGLVNWIADTVIRSGQALRHTQTGFAQSYIVWMALGVFLLAMVYIVL